jgi:hypothetical protein
MIKNVKVSRKSGKKNLKRYTTRISRSIKSHGTNIRIELDDTIKWNNGGNQPLFNLNVSNYVLFRTILAGSPVFISQSANFYKYKITGMSCMSYFMSNPTQVASSFGVIGTPPCMIGAYPTFTSVTAGVEVVQSDSSLLIKPLTSSSFYKYWSSSTFYTGSGNSVGSWNQCNEQTNQQGQFSLFSNLPLTNGGGAALTMYAVRFCLYITLDGKTR